MSAGSESLLGTRTIALSFGRWGGFYITRRVVFRVCAGWIALTVIPFDIDPVLRAGLDALDA